MKKTKTPKISKVYEVRHYIKAHDAMEARRLAKDHEPDEIVLMRKTTVDSHARLEDAVSYVDLPPEWEEDDVPDEYSIGYNEKERS